MTVRCREGHESSEADYCSVCGGAIPPPTRTSAPHPPGRPPLAAAAPGGPRPAVCPSCGEARADLDARYCEVCRFDFVAQKPGPPPGARASSPQPPAAPTPPAPASPVVARTTPWQLVIAVDASLDTEPDADVPCPVGVPEHAIPLDRELLVGRRDDLRDIRPEIPINDPGASRRHAKFVIGGDGQPALQDLASTNGTKVNGVETVPGSRTVLKEADTVTLGRWTRITVRRTP